MAEQLPTGTLLVVTEDPAVEEEVRFGLSEDLEIVSVNDAESAIEGLQNFTPVAVVVDLRTGRSGGYSLVRDMSQIVRLAPIPVIVVVERDQDRWLATQAGATLILRKPLNSNELRAAVSSVLAA